MDILWYFLMLILSGREIRFTFPLITTFIIAEDMTWLHDRNSCVLFVCFAVVCLGYLAMFAVLYCCVRWWSHPSFRADVVLWCAHHAQVDDYHSDEHLIACCCWLLELVDGCFQMLFAFHMLTRCYMSWSVCLLLCPCVICVLALWTDDDFIHPSDVTASERWSRWTIDLSEGT